MSLNAKYINAGSLDEKVTIETYTTSKQTDGTTVKTWATHCSCWAGRVEGGMAKGGFENYEANRLTAINRIVWRVRYKSTITEIMRIKDRNGNYYYIDGIRLEGRDQWMLLETEKRD